MEFTALNLVPSMATSLAPYRSRPMQSLTNSLNTPLMQSTLSLRKSAMVLKSGASFFMSHMTSTFRWHSSFEFSA